MKTHSNLFIIPSAIIVLFFANAFTPAEVLGYYTRGLLALIIASVSGVAAAAAAITAVKKRKLNDPSLKNWILLTLLLSVPLIALFYFA
jgi:hypothetical protein